MSNWTERSKVKNWATPVRPTLAGTHFRNPGRTLQGDGIWTSEIPKGCFCSWSYRMPSVRPERHLIWSLKYRHAMCPAKARGAHQ